MAKHAIKRVRKSNKPAAVENTMLQSLMEEPLISNFGINKDGLKDEIHDSEPDSIIDSEPGENLGGNYSDVSGRGHGSGPAGDSVGEPDEAPDAEDYGRELDDGSGGGDDDVSGSGSGGGPGDWPSGGLDGGRGGGPGSRQGRKGCSNLFLIPIIALTVIAVLAWSWLALLSPDFSKKAEPYINKYFERIVSVLSFESFRNQASDSAISIEPMDKNGKTTDKNSQSANESTGSSATGTDNFGSLETTKDNQKPSLDLQIYEGPTYSAEDQTCSYSVKAVVTGDPTPVVQFSRDDSSGAIGPKTTLISLKRNATSYTLTATARNEYGTAMDSLTINWGCNMPPEVSEITLSSDIVYVNKQYDLSVTATDPDKDSLTYKWTVTGGTLSADNAPAVKWTTPAAPENYQVKIDITDSKGTLTSKTISVYVGSEKAPETTAPPATAPPTTAPPTTTPPTTAPPTTTTSPQQSTLDVPKKSAEGGYLEYGGETFAGGTVYAGDSSLNKPCVGFVSFDITPLAGKTITAAILTFTGSPVQGSPLSYCDAFWINSVDWGAEAITQSDFNLPGVAIQSFTSPTITCNADKLKTEIQNAITAGKTRFQIRVHFSGPYTNNNSAKDGWEYAQQNINLNVSYQ